MKRTLSFILVLVLLCNASAGCVQNTQEPIEQPQTYLKPLDMMFEVLNIKNLTNFWKEQSFLLNGFIEHEVHDFYETLENSTSYQEWATQKYQTRVASYQEQYGEDYVFSYRLDSQSTLDSEQIAYAQENYINEGAQVWKNILNELKTDENESWQKIDYVRELSAEDRIRIIQIIEQISNAYLSVQITEGYLLHYTHITNGSKLEAPIEKQETMTICLINGEWVNIDLLYSTDGYTVITFISGLFFELLISAKQ